MAIPAFFATGGLAASSTTDITLDVPFPATVNSGDFIIMFLGHRYTFDDPPAPWAKIDDHNRVTNLGFGAAWYIIADGTETGTVTLTGFDSGAPQSARMVSWTGADSFEVMTSIDDNTTDILHTDIVSGGPDRLAIVFGYALVDQTPMVSFTGETGGDLVMLYSDVVAVGVKQTHAIHSADMASAGTISGGSSWLGGSAYNWLSLAFTIYEAGGAPPVTPKFSGIILSGGF